MEPQTRTESTTAPHSHRRGSASKRRIGGRCGSFLTLHLERISLVVAAPRKFGRGESESGDDGQVFLTSDVFREKLVPCVEESRLPPAEGERAVSLQTGA